jgi:hypothetical protein
MVKDLRRFALPGLEANHPADGTVKVHAASTVSAISGARREAIMA